FSSTSQKREALDLIKDISKLTSVKKYFSHKLGPISWHNKSQIYFIENGRYFGDEASYNDFFHDIPETIQFPNFDAFIELKIRSQLKLINDLLRGFVQFEHIQPLLKRIDAVSNDLRKVINITNQEAKEK